MNNSLKLFLLGGYDLEMLTIKHILEGRNDCFVIDKHLQWDNALLSAYRDFFLIYKDMDIYGIELVENVPIPAHYHRIDHHNDKCSNPSSLEQVASLLNISLNREQQLVAANDKGYIPAMLELHATNDEISSIRYRDRAAQGIAEEDEKKAELSIEKHLMRFGDLIVVKSLTSHFSPICDRLFPYERLLIFTDAEWMFYGKGKDVLVNQFASEIEKKKIYHGGGERGYIGSVQFAYSKNDIISFVKQIIKEYGDN